MNQKREKFQKSCRILRSVSVVLLVITILASLSAAVGMVSFLTADPDSIDLYTASSRGKMTVTNGTFTAMIELSALPPSASLADGTPYWDFHPKAAGTVSFAASLVAGIVQSVLFLYCVLLFDRAADEPFSAKTGKYLRRIGLFTLLLAALPELLLTVLLALFAGGLWYFYPNGLPFTGILAGAVLYAAAHIFDYGCFLQQEYDETL